MNQLFEVHKKINDNKEFYEKLNNIAEQNFKEIVDFMKKYKFII